MKLEEYKFSNHLKTKKDGKGRSFIDFEFEHKDDFLNFMRKYSSLHFPSTNSKFSDDDLFLPKLDNFKPRDSIPSYISDSYSWRKNVRTSKRNQIKKRDYSTTVVSNEDIKGERRKNERLKAILNRKGGEDKVKNRDIKKRQNERLKAILNGIKSRDKSKDTIRKQNERLEIILRKQKECRRKLYNSLQISANLNFPDVELPETILSYFKDNELFIYSYNKLYTIEPINEDGKESKYFFSFSGREFKLEESEDLRRLEFEYLKRNKERIEELQKRCLEKLTEEYNELREEFSNLKKVLEKKFSFEEFFQDFIIPLYHQEKVIESNYEKIEIPDEDLSTYVETEIEFSRPKNSFLEKVVKEIEKEEGRIGGLIFLLDNVLAFRPLSMTSRKRIRLENTSYLCRIEELEERYQRKIKEYIKKRIGENLSLAYHRIREGKEKIKKLKPKNRSVKSKDIGFKKVNNNEYIVYKVVPDFLYIDGNNYYHFPETKVCTIVYKRNGNINIGTTLYVYEKYPYKHPFVYSSSEELQKICHGNGQIKDKAGIKGTYPIKNINRKRLAIDILNMLYLAENTITKSNPHENTPVRSLGSINSRRICRERGEELIRKGIKFRRV